MAEPPRHDEDVDPRVGLCDPGEDGFRVVRRRVEDVDDAGIATIRQPVHHRRQALVEQGDGCLLAKDRAHDVNLAHLALRS